MKQLNFSISISIFFMAMLAVSAKLTSSKSKPNYESYFKRRPILDDNAEGSPDMDLLLSHAFELANIEGVCSQNMCLDEHNAAICNPKKIDTYRSKCAQVFSTLGLQKADVDLDEESKATLEEAFEKTQRTFEEDPGIREAILGGVEKVMGKLEKKDIEIEEDAETTDEEEVYKSEL